MVLQQMLAVFFLFLSEAGAIRTAPYTEPRDGENTEKDDKGTPTIVGGTLIGVMVITSVILFVYNYKSERHGRSWADFRGAYAVNVLSIADDLSDIGFIITTHILAQEETNSQKKAAVLAVIAGLSLLVLVVSHVFVAVAVAYLLSRPFDRREGSDEEAASSTDEEPARSLWSHLKDNLTWKDRLLFPGLLCMEVDVMKNLPWGEGVIDEADEGADGFPSRGFKIVSIVAAVIEDVPQIVLQSIFIRETNDGWAITGAMASLTFSIMYTMVKIGCPFLAKLCNLWRRWHWRPDGGRDERGNDSDNDNVVLPKMEKLALLGRMYSLLQQRHGPECSVRRNNTH